MKVLILITFLFALGCATSPKITQVAKCPSEPIDIYIMTPMGPLSIHFEAGEMDYWKRQQDKLKQDQNEPPRETEIDEVDTKPFNPIPYRSIPQVTSE